MRSIDANDTLPLAGCDCFGGTREARLRLAAMTTMASTLAHEISQPLAAASNYIHGCARALRGREEGLEDLVLMIEQASRETIRAGEIVRRMRSFIVDGQVTGHREDLRAIIDQVRSELASGDIEILTAIAPEARFVLADRIQIEQVFANILINACEAVHGCDTRRIAISATRHGNEIVVRVADSGPGFADDILARLFEPLFTTKADGMGLGLPICRTIVEAHGGRLSAEKGTKGGAVLSLVLRAADQEP